MTTFPPTAPSRRLATLALALTATAALAACGSDPDPSAAASETTTTTVVEPTTTTTTAPAIDRPTALLDTTVGVDGRQMHIRCVGEGTSTVLLIGGWGDGGDSWGAIEPALAERARVCSYARFGTGTSDAPTAVQTFSTEATDLEDLLAAAGEPGPYVVVGHSFGGAEAVEFTSRHGDEVEGVVLLDASPVRWPEAVCAVTDDGSDASRSYVDTCAAMRDPSSNPERLDAVAAFAEVAAITTLDDVALTVVTAAQRATTGMSAEQADGLNTAWNEGQAGWASLSSTSSVVTVESGHYVQLDQPAVVVDAVLALVR